MTQGADTQCVLCNSGILWTHKSKKDIRVGIIGDTYSTALEDKPLDKIELEIKDVKVC